MLRVFYCAMPPVYIVQKVFCFLFSILIRRTRAIPCSSAVHEPHGAAVSRGRGSPALRAYPLPATLLPTVQPIPSQAQPSPCHPNLAHMHVLFRRTCMATRPVPRRGCRRRTRRAACRGGAAPASLSLRRGGGATTRAATGEQHGRRVATTLTNAQIGDPL